MRRREFITLVGGMAASPFAARAQKPTKPTRIGYLDPATASLGWAIEAFRQGLHSLGYTEGKDIILEIRRAEGNYDRLPALAIELIHFGIDILVTYSNPGVLAAKQATDIVPIVISVSGDAVGSGLVTSLNRPGGNVTGQTFLSPQLNAKRLEFLKEVLPQSNRIAVLFNPSNTISPAILETMGLTAASLKLVLYHFQVRRLDELERSFSNMNATRVDAIVVVEDPFVVGATELIGQLVMAHRLPAIGFLELAAAGGLIAYAVDFVEMSRHAATFVDKIIRGAKPYQLPIEEPHKFKLVINLKTAQTFGLNLPSTFAARADEVIE